MLLLLRRRTVLRRRYMLRRFGHVLLRAGAEILKVLIHVGVPIIRDGRGVSATDTRQYDARRFLRIA